MSGDRARDDGFTLVEVLVSLAIFSLAVLGMNHAATQAVSATSSLQTRTHAGFVADNAVALARIQTLDIGTDRAEAESGGMTFERVTEVSETEQAGLYQIVVRVTEADRERVIAERRGFRYVSPLVSVVDP